MFLTRPPLRRPGRFVSPVLAGGACRAIFDIVDQTVGTGSLLAGPASPMRRPGGQGRRAYAEYDSFELRVFALDTPYHPNPSSPSAGIGQTSFHAGHGVHRSDSTN